MPHTYAVVHGFDYRIIKPGPVAHFAKHHLRDATPRHNNTERAKRPVD